MNGVDNILKKISSDASEAERVTLEQAQLNASEIVTELNAQGAFERAQILENAKHEAEQRRSRILSAAQMEGKKRLLAQKQRLIDEAFEKAKGRLHGLSPDEYAGVLAGMASALIKSGGEQLLISPQDAERLGDRLTAALSARLPVVPGVAVSADVTGGGFILKAGDVEINCTFDALLRQYREELELKVAATLFS